MDPLCPRCHSLLTPAARYCAECGAPQLTVETIALEAEEGGANASGAQAGTHIAWPTAIGVAALLSLPVGLLSSLLSFSTLWVIAGGVWTVALYKRRASLPRSGSLTSGLGGRIGCVFGVFAALVATCVDAVTLLIDRYGLHHGSEIDRRLHVAMQSGIDRVVASNPDAVHQIPWFFHFWLSADGQAGLVLASAVLSAGSMLGFSALGGALGARYAGTRTLRMK